MGVESRLTRCYLVLQVGDLQVVIPTYYSLLITNFDLVLQVGDLQVVVGFELSKRAASNFQRKILAAVRLNGCLLKEVSE